MLKNEIIKKIKNGLIVSCQAFKNEPTYDLQTIVKFAAASEEGGAAAVRINNPRNILEVKKKVSIPIFGIYKLIPKKYDKIKDVIITPTLSSALEVYEAGADIIAIDCSFRANRTKTEIRKLINDIKSNCDVLLMGEISNLEEAIFAESIGVDIVSTTIAGYTPYTIAGEGPDFALLERLVNTIKVPINAEGRFSSPEEVKKALNLGAWCVTVGSYITRPHRITDKFVKEMRKKLK